MKNLILLAVALGSVSAYATDSASLKETSVGGLGGPISSKGERICELKGGQVTHSINGKVTQGPTAIAWRDDVSDDAEMLRLLKAVDKKDVTTTMGRAGGTTSTITGTIIRSKMRDQTIQLRRSGRKTERNVSPAAVTLLDFLQYNCDKQ